MLDFDCTRTIEAELDKDKVNHQQDNTRHLPTHLYKANPKEERAWI